jgi:hypothetical protein
LTVVWKASSRPPRTVVSGVCFSSDENSFFLMGAMMGWLRGCVSSSCTIVSASGYTSDASG